MSDLPKEFIALEPDEFLRHKALMNRIAALEAEAAAEHAAREEAEAALHAIYDSVDYLGFPSFEEWLGSYKRRTGGTT